MKVIFLDIDGVLNDEEFYILRADENSQYHNYYDKPYPLSEFDPRCVERINKIVKETGAKIVLSSSWRSDDTPKLLNIFKQVDLTLFTYKTPYIYDFDPLTQKIRDVKRGEEIQKFLDEHPYIDKYVIIDDDSDMLPHQMDNFIKCNAYYGISDNDTEKAIKLLGTIEDDLKEYWDNLKPFESPDDIPDIPVCKNKKIYEDIIIKNLIRCGAIPKDKLKNGKTYIGSCRNASEAIWNGKEFEYKRYKWGIYENDAIEHFEDEMEYDVFIPIKEKIIN